MNTGKRIRLNRFRYAQAPYGMIVPIDHGLTIGPVAGLGSVAQVSRWIGHSAITGIIAHKGMIERLAEEDLLGRAGVMVHVNGMSVLGAEPDRKEMVTTVESAVRLGADGISLQVNFDGRNDAHNLQLLGAVVDEASQYGLPVLTMLYDKVASDDRKRVERLRHLMRITIELGTDAIKLAAPANTAEIGLLLEGLSEDVDIYFAGGPVCATDDLHELIRATIAAGGAGLCIGRNVFQRPQPGELLSALATTLLAADRPSLFHERAKHGVH